MPSFAEYNFTSGCVPPACPSDYGTLCGRSPYTDCSIEGSMQSASVYMYLSATQCAVKDDATWSSTLSAYSQVKTIIDNLALTDVDLQVQQPLYNLTVAKYTSVQYFLSGSTYASVHRTYPGTIKTLAPTNCGTDAYVPPARSWFSGAQQDKLTVQFYNETFSKKLVLNLATKISTGTTAGATTVRVNAQ